MKFSRKIFTPSFIQGAPKDVRNNKIYALSHPLPLKYTALSTLSLRKHALKAMLRINCAVWQWTIKQEGTVSNLRREVTKTKTS